MLVEADNDSPFLPRATWSPDTLEAAFYRLRERAPSTPVALLWLKAWARADAFHRSWKVPASPLRRRLVTLDLQTADAAVVFWLGLSDFDLGQLLLPGGIAQPKYAALATLVGSRVHPDLFFPSSDGAGFLGLEQGKVYRDLFDELSRRLGAESAVLRPQFEAWVRRRPKPVTLGPALVRFLRSGGIDLGQSQTPFPGL